MEIVWLSIHKNVSVQCLLELIKWKIILFLELPVDSFTNMVQL